MKLSVGLFFAGVFGALGILLFLVAFGTDYWLLATETCTSAQNRTENGDIVYFQTTKHTFHHEGFFWRCWFNETTADINIWKFWFKNQPALTYCRHAYLIPFPVSAQAHNYTAYETAIIYRGFWTVFMMLGVVAVIIGGFIIICAAPFSNHKLYYAGGGLFLSAAIACQVPITPPGLAAGAMCLFDVPLDFPAAYPSRSVQSISMKYFKILSNVRGILFSILIIMYVIWIEAIFDLNEYKQQIASCSDFTLDIQYGWSFIIASIGIFFSLLAGLLFLLAGRTIHVHYT